MSDKPSSYDEKGRPWFPVTDDRMRYEKSHPQMFTGEGRTEEERDAYRRNYEGIDWSDGRPNQAKPRKTYPHVKAKGLF